MGRVELESTVRMVEEEYARACSLLRLPGPPLVFDPTIRNASSDGLSVAVNPIWMHRALNAVCGPDEARRRAAVLGIMAHELGHHHDPAPSPDVWMRERYADAVAGMVLGRAGMDIEPMIGVLLALPVSPNHPRPPERRTYLRLGQSRSVG